MIGALAGGALLLVPVLLKTHLKVDEVVTTLLLNFVVLLVVSYLIEGPWKDPASLGLAAGGLDHRRGRTADPAGQGPVCISG